MLSDAEYQLINFSGTRNVVTLSYAAGLVAPHGFTVRVTYTVPADRVAIVEFARTMEIRDGATATPARTNSGIQYTPNGGTATSVVVARYATGTLGDSKQDNLSHPLFMFAGDVLTLFSSDLSTGGTNAYDVTAVVLEFAPNGV